MGLGIVLVPMIGILESIAIAKAFGRKNGYRICASQEILALGLANIVGSFVQAFPVSSIFSYLYSVLILSIYTFRSLVASPVQL